MVATLIGIGNEHEFSSENLNIAARLSTRMNHENANITARIEAVEEKSRLIV